MGSIGELGGEGQRGVTNGIHGAAGPRPRNKTTGARADLPDKVGEAEDAATRLHSACRAHDGVTSGEVNDLHTTCGGKPEQKLEGICHAQVTDDDAGRRETTSTSTLTCCFLRALGDPSTLSMTMDCSFDGNDDERLFIALLWLDPSLSLEVTSSSSSFFLCFSFFERPWPKDDVSPRIGGKVEQSSGSLEPIDPTRIGDEVIDIQDRGGTLAVHSPSLSPSRA